MKKIRTLATIGLIGCASTFGNNYQELPSVSVSQRVGNGFIYLYADKEIEFPVCIEGTFRDNTYFLERLVIPTIYTATETNSSFDINTCYSENYLGMAHAHPKEVPYPSPADINRFVNDSRARLEIIVSDVKLTELEDSVRMQVITKESLEAQSRNDTKR